MLCFIVRKSSGIIVITLLNYKNNRASEKVLIDYQKLARQQMKEFLGQLPPDAPQRQRLTDAYERIQQRLGDEILRKDSKYGITLRELIQIQQKTPEATAHNEVLAANTKGAMRALYASKDELFDRLNLAFHAMDIKKQWSYDVPLLVMSKDKPPYHYTEAMIKADLLKAYELIKTGAFPYVRSLHVVFETEEDKGAIKFKLDAIGNLIPKKDALGVKVKVPKNMEYQQNLLVNLFKMGFDDLANLDAIEHGVIDGATVEKAVSTIVQKMGVMAGPKHV